MKIRRRHTVCVVMVVVNRASEYNKPFASKLVLQYSETTNTTHTARQELGTVSRFLKKSTKIKKAAKSWPIHQIFFSQKVASVV